MSIAAAQTSDSAFTVPIRRDDLLRKWLPLALILGAAVALRHFLVANTDVSWQITLCEKILDGQRLYVDLIELNPPASVFLYLPAVALARAFGWSPEIIVDTLVFIGALVSLGIASHIACRYRLLDGLNGWAVAAVALAVLTILPAQTFGEREHIALIAVLPAFATLVARAKGARPLLWYCLVAGAGAGVTICIKPQFALAGGLAVAAAALHLRSWRVLFALENRIAASIAIIYAIFVVIFYRAFFTNVMPVVSDLYLPVRLPLAAILIQMPVVAWAGAVLAALGLRRGTGGQPALLVTLAASAGFAAAYFIQGKGWSYHSYPMLALALIALDLAAAVQRRADELRGDRCKSVCATVALGVIAVCSFVWLNIAVDTRAAAELVKRVAPPHPSIAAISDDIAIGHPLVRAVHGRWISCCIALWITQNAAILRSVGGLDEATLQRVSADVQAERQRVIGEIRDGKPDVILVDNRPGGIVVDDRVVPWSEWVNADRELFALVAANYREIGRADGVIILERHGT